MTEEELLGEGGGMQDLIKGCSQERRWIGPWYPITTSLAVRSYCMFKHHFLRADLLRRRTVSPQPLI